MAEDHDRPLLTLRQVKEWQAEKATLLSKIKAMQERVSTLNQKLVAAAFLMEQGEAGTRNALVHRLDLQTAPRANGSESQEPMTDAVERVVREADAPLRMTDLKKELAAAGFSQKQLDGYVYTVATRLVRQGRIVRHNNRFSAPVLDEASPESPGAPS